VLANDLGCNYSYITLATSLRSPASLLHNIKLYQSIPYRISPVDLDRDFDLRVVLIPIRLRSHTGTFTWLPASALFVGEGLAAFEVELVEMRVSDSGLGVRLFTSACDLVC